MAQSNTAQKRLSGPEDIISSEPDPESKTAMSSLPTTQFVYNKLLPDEVRLLRLLPTSSLNETALAGELINVKISEQPLYTAVSYAWDSSAVKTSITIDGMNLVDP